MTTKEISSILENVYQGPTWYGKSIGSTIRDIPVGKALLRLEESYNVAELISHMLAWRIYVINLLETGKHYQVSEVDNFPTIEVMMMDEWQDLIDRFEDSQRHLVNLLDTVPVDLDAKVPEKPYRYREVLIGIIHHDIYHAGQLNLLSKFL